MALATYERDDIEFRADDRENAREQELGTRFINRHKDQLTPRWTSAINADRHAADSYDKYKLYIDIL